jgi:hypothetical protein
VGERNVLERLRYKRETAPIDPRRTHGGGEQDPPLTFTREEGPSVDQRWRHGRGGGWHRRGSAATRAPAHLVFTQEMGRGACPAAGSPVELAWPDRLDLSRGRPRSARWGSLARLDCWARSGLRGVVGNPCGDGSISQMRRDALASPPHRSASGPMRWARTYRQRRRLHRGEAEGLSRSTSHLSVPRPVPPSRAVGH